MLDTRLPKREILMPLMPGSSKKAKAHNMRLLLAEGRPRKQAIAITLENARRTGRAGGTMETRLSDEARELDLYSENEENLYKQAKLIDENLAKKAKKGQYDPSKAPVLWSYLVERSAKQYAKEFGGTWNKIFSIESRRELAVFW